MPTFWVNARKPRGPFGPPNPRIYSSSAKGFIPAKKLPVPHVLPYQVLQRLQELSEHGMCQTIATGTYEERSFIVMDVRRREGGRRGVGKACYREKQDVSQGPFPLTHAWTGEEVDRTQHYRAFL